MDNIIGRNIITLAEVDSTNNYANQLEDDKSTHGTVILADSQIDGRGQRGNVWESEAGKNLILSVILKHKGLAAQEHFMLNIFCSLSICHTVQEFTGEECCIKWPNDIYLLNNKICGILIENTINGSNISKSIIGIGLNVNQARFSKDIPNPTSIYTESGTETPVKKVFELLIENLNRFYRTLADKEYKYLHDAYLSKLYRIGETHQFIDKTGRARKFKGEIIGINDLGQLQILDSKGKLREFNFKEVEFVI
ncbi:MAG: biotin--[acetyl-CoA-carboxylase] ligase [Bacteroidales bacterium]